MRGRREVNDGYKVGREPEGGQNDTARRGWPAEMTVAGRRKRCEKRMTVKRKRERKK